MANNLQILIDNVANGGTLTLSSNVVIASTAIVSKEISIDLNGYLIKNTTDIWSPSTRNMSLISVRENGNLTIVDNSKAQTGALLAKENDCYAIDVQGNGTLTINSGSYIGNCSSIYVESGTAYIKGGYYKIQQLSTAGNEYGETINCLDANYKNGTAKVVITGGSFYKFDPTDAAEPQGYEQSYLPEGFKMVYDKGTGSYGVVTTESSTNTNRGLKVIATKSDRIRNLVIENNQLIFIQDLGRIAFDFNNTRTFYNQIVELESEAKRLTLENPLNGYYFVISSACLYRYDNGWTQITEKPKEVVFIGVELPELGQAKEGMLYVNKAEREIAVFDSASNEYIIVSDYTNEVTADDIENLFK